jgi:hypothetical protein
MGTLYLTPYKEPGIQNIVMHSNVKERRLSPCTWNRLLLEKITVGQLLKKFLSIYGTRSFITVFTKHQA